MNVHYLNTDLEIESKQDLTPIVESFGEETFNLYNGKGKHDHFLAIFEMAGLVDSPD